MRSALLEILLMIRRPVRFICKALFVIGFLGVAATVAMGYHDKQVTAWGIVFMAVAALVLAGYDKLLFKIAPEDQELILPK